MDEKEEAMSTEMFEKGRQIRTDVLGAERVNKALDDVDDFNRDFQHLVTEYCWGACWCPSINAKGLESFRESTLF